MNIILALLLIILAWRVDPILGIIVILVVAGFIKL